MNIVHIESNSGHVHCTYTKNPIVGTRREHWLIALKGPVGEDEGGGIIKGDRWGNNKGGKEEG